METTFPILVVEDQESDFILLKRAFERVKVTNTIQWARDGYEALDYLQGKGKFADRFKYPLPDILIVDLKMPRMSGFELLAYIHNNPDFRVIPTVVMSASKQDSDLRKAYDLGASTFFVKPTDFHTLVELVKRLYDYWRLAEKPPVSFRQKPEAANKGK
jgi:CheY-like chemotaxis protein